MLRFVLSALVLAGCATPTLAEYKLEIGPDTTVIDGPLNPDGTINYLVYLNKKLSEGVTPENNFAVDVAMVMPPAPNGWISEEFRESVSDGLGVAKPINGPFIKSIRSAISDSEDISFDDPRLQNWLEVISRPWKSKDHPDIKQWLDDQSEILHEIQNSVNIKSRFYFPWVVEEGEPEAINKVLMPWLGSIREIARGYQARAGWNIANGRLDAAWSDARTMHRLANLTMQEPHRISWLLGVSIHRKAALIVNDLVESEYFSSEYARQMIAGTQQLGGVRPYHEVLYEGTRFELLDTIMQYWKGRGDLFPEPSENFFGLYLDKKMYRFMETEHYNPSVTLRALNKWSVRWVLAGKIDNYLDRLAVIEKYDQILTMQGNRVLKLIDDDPDAAEKLRKEIAVSNKETVITTCVAVDTVFLGRGVFYEVEAQIKMRLELVPVVLAIGGYHAEHGEYPSDLQDLVPAYLDSLPLDFATGELPVYRIEDGAAIIYSLGTNLKDDGGVDDNEDGDIVFRIER